MSSRPQPARAASRSSSPHRVDRLPLRSQKFTLILYDFFVGIARTGTRLVKECQKMVTTDEIFLTLEQSLNKSIGNLMNFMKPLLIVSFAIAVCVPAIYAAEKEKK